MVTRLRAQAAQLVFKSKAAEARGDHALWLKLQREWTRLMRLALEASGMCG